MKHKAKYKVGDKVRVKSLEWFKEHCEYNNLYNYYVYKGNHAVFVEPMQQLCGQVVTICEVINTDHVSYHIAEDEDKWTFTNWMLERTDKETKEDTKGDKNMYIIIDKEDMGLVTKGLDFKDCFYNTLCEAEVEAQKYAKDMDISVDKLCVLSMADNTDVYEFTSELSHAYELGAIKEK